MAILNYTTKIDAWRTISEIQQILSKHGATHFSIKNEGGRPVAVSFSVDFKGQPLNFLLPCNHLGIWKLLKDNKKAGVSISAKKEKNDEPHSFKVGWRIIKDWIEAQLALVEVEMVSVQEVFMPYLIINSNGQTLADRILNNDGLKLLN